MGKKKAKAATAAMVLSGSGGALSTVPATRMPQLKEAPADLAWNLGSTALMRKWVRTQIEAIYAANGCDPLGNPLLDDKGKPKVATVAKAREEVKNFGLKILVGGYVGTRTFAKGDITAHISNAAIVNGAILFADML